ncbi:MAG: MATE family efflux transporter [Eubacteriales bacterium]|nr:MATE family efflux transporter [Eubacteriales bacterium]
MQKRDLTQGPIIRTLVLFAMPMMAGNMLQQLYNITDTMIVGRFVGTEALAAVGSAYTLMVFITSVLIGMCMGSGNLYSISIGAGESEKMKKDVLISFTFIALLTLVIYGIVYGFLDGIIVFMRIPSDVAPLIREYMAIVFAGIGFVSLYNFFAYVLRSMGNSMTPFYFLIASTLCNIFLDLLFVVNFGMGIAGAALATVIAQGISGIGIMFFVLIRMPQLRPHFESFGQGIRYIFDSARWKAIMENDVATSAQQSVMNFGILMIQGLVNSFGTTVMAAFAAAAKIDTFAYMPAQEFSNAFSLFVSQNHGAGRKDRVRDALKKAVMVSVSFCFLVSVCIWFVAEKLMEIFVSPEKTAVIAEGVRYLHIEGATYVGIGILFLWYAYYRGIQKPHISLILTIVSLGTRVALSYSFAPYCKAGVLIIWWSITIGWFLADAVGLGIYKKEKGLL